MFERPRLGAPGIYELPDVPLRALTGERMDVCAFVGVAPRGPARTPVFSAPWAPTPCEPGRTAIRSVPVPVESWSEYRRLFGGFEGPGLLPYAVASFFENGGRRAWVVRIVHDYGPGSPGNAEGVARARLLGARLVGGGDLWVRARSEGTWGNALSARLRFTARPLAFDPSTSTPGTLVLARDTELPRGTLLRLTLSGTQVLRFASDVGEEWHPELGLSVLRATLSAPIDAVPQLAEVVEGELQVDDGDGRAETLERLGLSAAHPRWLARALVEESALLYPDDTPGRVWIDRDLDPALPLPSCTTEPFSGGEDRYPDLVPEDFLDPRWTPGDECPGEGVQSLADTPEIALLVVPDLYSPQPLVPLQPVVTPASLAGPDFAPCLEPPPPPSLPVSPPSDLIGLRLDPEQPAALARIIALQRTLVAFAEQLQSFVVLLDVPPRLGSRRILSWRASFTSAFAAAYHPWLEVARQDDQRNTLVRLNPSAVAAGIIARRESESGVQHGPANVLARGVVALAEPVPSPQHDILHPAGINVYLRERDGIRLTAARTLSLDPDYRQLSVRRLVTLLRRVLERQMQWMVFEPNDGRLRKDVHDMLRAYLRQLFLANAFQGDSEEEAFFVRCDESLNPRAVVDSGRLIAEIGVAPAEPLEFIVLRIAREGDGTLRVGG